MTLDPRRSAGLRRAATMVEYTFMLAFVALVIVVAVASLGITTRRPFENTAGVLGRDSGSGAADSNGGSAGDRTGRH